MACSRFPSEIIFLVLQDASPSAKFFGKTLFQKPRALTHRGFVVSGLSGLCHLNVISYLLSLRGAIPEAGAKEHSPHITPNTQNQYRKKEYSKQKCVSISSFCLQKSIPKRAAPVFFAE
jgi:hypothetical protein